MQHNPTQTQIAGDCSTLGDRCRPTIDVIIPAYNQSNTLERAIESVLDQNYRSLTVTVVDDGSSDQIEDVAQKYSDRVAFIRQKNAGASAARNTGVKSTTGNFVLFLDADDCFANGLIQAFADAASHWPRHDLFYGAWINVYEADDLDEDHRRLSLQDDAFHQILNGYCPAIHSVMIRRDLIEKVGQFDESLRRQEDWDFWLRVAAVQPRFIFVENAVSIYHRRRVAIPGRDLQEVEGALSAIRKIPHYHSNCSVCRTIIPDVRSGWRKSYIAALKAAVTDSFRSANHRQTAEILLKAVFKHSFVLGYVARALPRRLVLLLAHSKTD